MTTPTLHHQSPGVVRRAGVLAVGGLLAAIAMLGCAPSNVPSLAVSPSGSPQPSAAASDLAPSMVPASASPSTIGSTTFDWAARPYAFAGGGGTSLAKVAAGPAGLVALSVLDHVDGTRVTRLWGSSDSVTWMPLDDPGVDEHHGVTGVWGAGGSYWLVEQHSQTGDRARLWRSADGRTWQPSLELDPGLEVRSISDGCEVTSESANDACPLVLTGTVGVDGAIWRSVDAGDTWARTTVEDATGWSGVQDGAPVEIRGVRATSSGLLAFGNGLPHAEDTSGFLQSRLWRSEDAGAAWSRLPHTALFGELVVRDVAADGDVVVAVGEDASAPGVAVALMSTDGGRTWSRAATPGLDAQGNLAHVFARGSGFVGLGFSGPAEVRESFWTSDAGTSWRTGPAGALDGGIVDDAVIVDGRIVAVGRGWTTTDTGTWDAPFGPAAWTLAP